jgi:hypothetical protein
VSHSCIPQVRIHGCKGVLSRNSMLDGERFQVRHSMTKFGSDHPQLEVCSTAAWIPAYLNRQVIIMMDYNGVPSEVSRYGCLHQSAGFRCPFRGVATCYRQATLLAKKAS